MDCEIAEYLDSIPTQERVMFEQGVEMTEQAWLEYADFVAQLSERNGKELSTRDAYMLGSMGLAGESGEVIDLLKKHVWHDHELDRNKLLLELGDVLWYLQLITDVAGYTLEQVRDANMAKLSARYPNKVFDTELSKKHVEGAIK